MNIGDYAFVILRIVDLRHANRAGINIFSDHLVIAIVFGDELFIDIEVKIYALFTTLFIECGLANVSTDGNAINKN